MKVMNKVTWESMRQNRTRTVMTLLGIILSVTLFCTVLTVVASARDYLIRLSIRGNGDYYFNMIGASQSDYERLAGDPAVSELADVRRLGASKEEFPYAGNLKYYAADPKFWEVGNLHLMEGRLPENRREVLVFSHRPIMVKVGDQITVNLEDDRGEITCTVVGLADIQSHCGLYLSDSLLTIFQNGGPESDYHVILGKTSPASYAVNISKQSWDAPTVDLNAELLGYYGIFLDDLTRRTFYVVAVVVLLGIVTACSVSLIHNAFSISVSQRMKQYGVLSSVGATGRQIFKSVAFEAWVLYLVGTPLGLLLGYGLAGALIAMIRYYLGYFLQLPLTLLFSPLVLLGASLMSLATVFLSAWIPSVRARRTVAIEAIRQSRDYHVPNRIGKNLRSGVPAAMARKYYRTSGKKYRATVSALAVSLALVILAGFFTDILNTYIAQDAELHNYDLAIYTQDPDTIAQIRTLPGVERAALADWNSMARSPMWTECISQDYLEYLKQIWRTEDINYGSIYAAVLYLEDNEYETCLRENGLDPAAFPPGTAFVLDQRKSRTTVDSNGDRQTVSVDLTYLKEDVSEFFLISTHYDSEKVDTLLAYGADKLGLTVDPDEMVMLSPDPSRDGTLMYTISLRDPDSDNYDYNISIRFEIRLNKEANATEYYYLDPDTGKPEDTAVWGSTTEVKKLSIGGHIQKKPFGYDSGGNDGVVFLMPLSAASEDDLGETGPELRVKCSDISLVLNQLSDKNLAIYNMAESEMIGRSVVSIVSLVSAVFVGMILFMASANIFNTLSTNLLLRSRDYAMLESVGMGHRDVLKMIGFECAIYGLRSLLWGLPISVALCWLVAKLTYIPFRFPFVRILAAVLVIAGVVLVSFAYARTKLRKGSLMEAIRNENL